MTEYSTEGVCTPTAATNICIYWYGRNPEKYGKLYDNNKWKDTYQSFYTLMKTELSGTARDNIPLAYVAYFKSKGLSCTSSLTNGTSSGKKVRDELSNDRPCHLSLINSNTYSNGDGGHSVLALGYKDYWYSNLSGWVDNNIYIRIADGWSETPTRFVFGNCSGSWSYTTVIPN